MDLASGVAGLASLSLEITDITGKYIRAVHNAPENAKQLHRELSALIQSLDDLQRFLTTQGSRQKPFENTSALVASTNVCTEDLSHLRLRLLKFKEIYEKKKWYRRLLWPFQEEEHAYVVQRIKDYTQTFHFSVSLEGCELLAKTSQEVDRIRERLDSSSGASEISAVVGRLNTSIEDWAETQRRQLKELESIRKSQQDNERLQLLVWLSKADPSTNYNTATKKKEPGTGEWFLASDAFTNWLEAAGFVWLHGIPGCGKTVLCSTIIEEVEHLCRAPTGDRYKSAYFYFDFQRPQEHRSEAMLRSLLRQLSANELKISPSVQELYERFKQNGHSPSTKHLETVLIETIKNLGKEVYIMLDALDEIPEDGNKRAEILKHITTLVRLGIKNLHILTTSRDELDIRESLKDLSNGGISMQSSAVDPDIKKYVRSCLQDWPRRLPEHVKALIETRLVEGSQGIMLIAAVEGHNTDIVSSILGFGVDINAVVRDWPSWPEESKGAGTALQYASWRGYVEVVHCLLKNGAEADRPGPRFGTALQAALTGFNLENIVKENKVMKIVLLLLKHGADKDQEFNLTGYMPYSTHRWAVRGLQGTPLQFAAIKGYNGVAKLLVDLGADINNQHEHSGSALMSACAFHKNKAVRLLLDLGADINAQHEHLGTALMCASRHSGFAIEDVIRSTVQLLLDSGADVNIQVAGVGTALSAALCDGGDQNCYGIAALLIEAGGDLAAAIEVLGTALSATSEIESREIFKCFIIATAQERPLGWVRRQRKTSGYFTSSHLARRIWKMKYRVPVIRSLQ
ncbi:hypothetical protein VPNG_01962 [Cytospora leucostoma]|uniref:Nephrocystin 3-like N-terminal domain-containing protein n=1 Tax=Cytospora leucostoma TaxID=1230097 RepID=A0A423XIL4_9PEZI|nr:hypothetical protein VPNG_01962 [Cytospora leucostoma]